MMSKTLVTLLTVTYISVASAQWENIPGGLKEVSANINYLWGVTSSDQVYMCSRPCSGDWIFVAGG